MNKTKIIDGIEFFVSPFMAVEALRLKAYLVRTFGPALGQILSILKDLFPKSGDIGDIKLDGEVLALAIENLMSKLDEDNYEELIKRLFRNVTAKGKTKGGDGKEMPYMRKFDASDFANSMNLVFTGKLFTVYPVMAFILEVNYPDFFDKVVRNFGKRMMEIASSEPGSETETEKSNGSATSEGSNNP